MANSVFYLFTFKNLQILNLEMNSITLAMEKEL